ncbi:MAG: glycosyltransferase family 2 protein [Acholeplasma sp.]|nr:glycosyltransferase family 2 protein [Acholeplasma sp.]
MEEKLVSIVTPCYNGAKYLDNYFMSVLSQNYSNCELIFIDDGSKDNSKDIVFKYKEQLEDKGIKLRYFYQENQGVGFAIANVLKFVNGDYFIWPDCDDVLLPNSISLKVQFLENNPEYGIVRTEGIIVHEDNPNKIINFFSGKRKDRFEENLFESYLFGKNAWLMPGSFMIRTSSFLEVNPDRYIFKTRNGQNWQILLPILYKYRCGYIDIPLYKYYLHRGSLSNQANLNYDKIKAKLKSYEEIIINTLEHMNIKDEQRYVETVKLYYINRLYIVAAEYRRLSDMEYYYKILKNCNDLNFKKKLIYILSRWKIFNSLIFAIRKIKNSL